MDKWKHLRVKEKTHIKVKSLAVVKGVGIDEVINFLLDEHNKKGVINANEDYRTKHRK